MGEGINLKMLQIAILPNSSFLVTHTCNPICLRGREQEDGGLRPAQEKS
jgi:hypothetical protein